MDANFDKPPIRVQRKQDTPRRRRTRRAINWGNTALAVVFGLFLLLVLFNFIWIFTDSANQARSKAKDAGFTKVTSVDHRWLSLCHKDYIAYHVEGIRDGKRDSITVCTTPLSFLAYTR